MHPPHVASIAGPVSRSAATRWVARCGEAAASLGGFDFVTEWSVGSESIYLHVCRGGVWWGVRVSCHPPAYACCRDYGQLLLPASATRARLLAAAWRVRATVLAGGDVVASPHDVRHAIYRLAKRLSDGRRYRDPRGHAWRWDSDAARWQPADSRQPSADCESEQGDPQRPAPPRHRGVRPLTPRARCEVRHTLNVNARWAAELANAKP